MGIQKHCQSASSHVQLKIMLLCILTWVLECMFSISKDPAGIFSGTFCHNFSLQLTRNVSEHTTGHCSKAEDLSQSDCFIALPAGIDQACQFALIILASKLLPVPTCRFNDGHLGAFVRTVGSSWEEKTSLVPAAQLSKSAICRLSTLHAHRCVSLINVLLKHTSDGDVGIRAFF